jgi:Na+/melibiose symporter-like transporter
VLITGLFAKEEINTRRLSLSSASSRFLKLIKLPSFRQYLGMLMLLQVTMVVMSGLFFFYIDFYLCRDFTAAGSSNSIGLISAALMFAMQIVALPFYTWLIRKAGKTPAYRFGAVIWIAAGLLLLLIKPGAPGWEIMLLGMVMGFGISGPGLAPHTMLGDVADAANVVFGERLDGVLGGLVNFLNMLSPGSRNIGCDGDTGLFRISAGRPGADCLNQPETRKTLYAF